ncbi:MAG TPA: glycerol-3-phosphate 1-O-acyltransferase PlsY [Candidatus Caccopulliclostridium gallistercoris]|uniref:Glycerol-3-phosphate acyltransferase n=1 Tax=Candidatus Caccopulliclostridium gallistercoris TaxID=2840719 RepID=A0A9D1NDR9_9FIRM|nr:glycerol-3-phosphate 1-O-acyltransferase PlsY [Candidatus Caccopulliclostridium gallistercoris]
MIALKYILLIVCSYLLGSVNFARILSKNVMHGDITKSGSGNPGTMNMLRTYGFKAGALTLVLDALKGVIPALVGYFLFGGDGSNAAYVGLYVGGLSAVVGHCFPVFYKFKGGKGVACVLGVFAVARPIAVLIFFVVAFIYLCIFDYASIASFIFITALTIIEAFRFRGDMTIALLLFVLFFLTFFMHRSNVFRLLIGKENKVNLISSLKKLGKKKKKS